MTAGTRRGAGPDELRRLAEGRGAALERIRERARAAYPEAEGNAEQCVADLAQHARRLEQRLAQALRDVQAADERFQRAVSARG